MSLTVFPAYAGMSPGFSSPSRPCSSFPRLRGDEPAAQSQPAPIRWFSPPTRG